MSLFFLNFFFFVIIQYTYFTIVAIYYSSWPNVFHWFLFRHYDLLLVVVIVVLCIHIVHNCKFVPTNCWRKNQTNPLFCSQMQTGTCDIVTPQNNLDKIVVNLSHFTLEQRHTDLLSRGLSFCPRPDEPDAGLSRADLDALHRRLRLSCFFENEEQEGNSEAPQSEPGSPFKHNSFKPKSKFNPVGPPTLEAMILANEVSFNKRKPYNTPTWDNLSPGERMAI